MKIVFLLAINIFYFLEIFSQNVGINTRNPQATLEVNGTLRVDSIVDCSPNISAWDLVCDSAGNVLRLPLIGGSSITDEVGPYLYFPYGSTISAGDLVSIGDGKSAYMCCNGDGPFMSNETSSATRLVAQGFRSTGGAVGVRAVNLRIPITNGANHSFTFSVREIASGGVPGATVSQQTISFVGTGNSTGWSLFVFDPPLTTIPQTDYFLVIQASANGNTRTIRTVSGGIATGALATSSNNGISWSLDLARDVEMQIYVVRTLSGSVYPSHTAWRIEVLDPRQETLLATSGQPILHDHFDRCNGVIGVAMESGGAGYVGKICVGPLLPINQVLVPGTVYYVDEYVGKVTAMVGSPSLLSVKLGYAISEHYLMIDR